MTHAEFVARQARERSRQMIRALVLAAALLVLSACIVAPPYGGEYWHPYHHYSRY